MIRKVIVNCQEKKPVRAFDLLMDEYGSIYVEIKFPGFSNAFRIKLDDYIRQLESM